MAVSSPAGFQFAAWKRHFWSAMGNYHTHPAPHPHPHSWLNLQAIIMQQKWFGLYKELMLEYETFWDFNASLVQALAGPLVIWTLLSPHSWVSVLAHARTDSTDLGSDEYSNYYCTVIPPGFVPVRMQRHIQNNPSASIVNNHRMTRSLYTSWSCTDLLLLECKPSSSNLTTTSSKHWRVVQAWSSCYVNLRRFKGEENGESLQSSGSRYPAVGFNGQHLLWNSKNLHNLGERLFSKPFSLSPA